MGKSLQVELYKLISQLLMKATCNTSLNGQFSCCLQIIMSGQDSEAMQKMENGKMIDVHKIMISEVMIMHFAASTCSMCGDDFASASENLSNLMCGSVRGICWFRERMVVLRLSR